MNSEKNSQATDQRSQMRTRSKWIGGATAVVLAGFALWHSHALLALGDKIVDTVRSLLLNGSPVILIVVPALTFGFGALFVLFGLVRPKNTLVEGTDGVPPEYRSTIIDGLQKPMTRWAILIFLGFMATLYTGLAIIYLTTDRSYQTLGNLCQAIYADAGDFARLRQHAGGTPSESDRKEAEQQLDRIRGFLSQNKSRISKDDQVRCLLAEGMVHFGKKDEISVADTISRLDGMKPPSVWDNGVRTLKLLHKTMVAKSTQPAKPEHEPVKDIREVVVEAERLFNTKDFDAMVQLLYPYVHSEHEPEINDANRSTWINLYALYGLAQNSTKDHPRDEAEFAGDKVLNLTAISEGQEFGRYERANTLKERAQGFEIKQTAAVFAKDWATARDLCQNLLAVSEKIVIDFKIDSFVATMLIHYSSMDLFCRELRDDAGLQRSIQARVTSLEKIVAAGGRQWQGELDAARKELKELVKADSDFTATSALYKPKQ